DEADRATLALPALLAVLGRGRRRADGGRVGVAALAAEGAGRRLDVVLLQPRARLALCPTRLAVARGDLGRDRRQRRQLFAALGLGRELSGVLLLGHADRALPPGVEEL